MIARPARICLLLAASIFAVAVGPSAAQPRPRVRVVDDDATIWRSPTGAMIVVVKAGTDLEVVAEQGSWFEVVVPGGRGDTRTGFIAAASVAKIVPGSPAPALRPSRRAPITAPAPNERAASTPLVRGFFQVSGGRFAASQTFDAVLGSDSGVWVGGGASVRVWRNAFAQVSIEHFSKAGQRVFVHNGQVFPLGIPDVVSVTPVEFAGGYTFGWMNRVRPYLGAGAGHYSFREESEVAGETDVVERGISGYHVLGGLEWRAWRWTSAALELKQRWVPDAFDAGTAAAFDEDDLGGFLIGAKVVVGW